MSSSYLVFYCSLALQTSSVHKSKTNFKYFLSLEQIWWKTFLLSLAYDKSLSRHTEIELNQDFPLEMLFHLWVKIVNIFDKAKIIQVKKCHIHMVIPNVGYMFRISNALNKKIRREAILKFLQMLPRTQMDIEVYGIATITCLTVGKIQSSWYNLNTQRKLKYERKDLTSQRLLKYSNTFL